MKALFSVAILYSLMLNAFSIESVFLTFIDAPDQIEKDISKCEFHLLAAIDNTSPSQKYWKIIAGEDCVDEE